MIVDPAKTPTPDVYGLMLRTILPRPIAWVSTISGAGQTNLAPFSFFTGVSSVPPSLCFCVGRRADGERKDTLRNLEETREFVVNLVPEELSETMNETATDFPHGVSEFAEARLTEVSSVKVQPPRVRESPVSMECRVMNTLPVGADGVGGATIVVGEIVLFHVAEHVLHDGKVDPERLRPLARLGGLEYAALGRRFTMARRKYTP